MAFWGAPHLNPQHAAHACAAAIRCQAKLHELRSSWQAAGKPAFETRIGIHTGDVIVGNIGSPQRMNFTIIGDTVNLASRLEGLNKIYRTEIIISQATYEQVKQDIVARPLDWVVVKGRAAPVLIFELLAARSEIAPEVLEFSELYSAALEHYKNRRWTESIQLLQKVLRSRPGDYPAQMLTIRCREFLANPPPDNWDVAQYMKRSKTQSSRHTPCAVAWNNNVQPHNDNPLAANWPELFERPIFARTQLDVRRRNDRGCFIVAQRRAGSLVEPS